MKARRLSTALWAAALLLLPAAATHAKKEKKEKPGRVPAAATHELTGNCTDSETAALWWSPQAPAVGHPFKIMAVGDGGGDLTVTDPQGGEKTLTTVRRDGPPTSVTGDFTPTRAGSHQLIWRHGGKPIACAKIAVAAKPPAPAMAVGANVWAAPHAWDRRYENLYSAWIASLFDAPIDQSLDFRPLHQA